MEFNKNNIGGNLKSQKLGLTILFLCLAAIISIAYTYLKHEHTMQIARMQTHGLELVRIISEVPYAQLTQDTSANGILALTKYYLGDPNFAYSVITDIDGHTLASTEQAGLVVPFLSPPADPSGWLVARKIGQASKENSIYDFQAPLIEKGKLKGFLRLGYFEPAFGLTSNKIPFLASLSLPIVMLIGFTIFLLRRGVKSIEQLGAQIDNSLKQNDLNNIELKADGELSEFIGNFNEFISMAQSKITNLSSDNRDLEASTKLLTYQQNKIKSVLQALPEGMIVIDESGQIIFSNSKVAAMFEADVDMPLDSDLSWCSIEEIKTFIRRIMLNPLGNYVNETLVFEPEAIPDRKYAINAYPLYSLVKESTIQGSLVLFRDVTEENLAKQARGEFIAHVAHEIKNPLNVLAMYSESLLREEGESREFRTEAVNVIQDEVERLSMLITNLLNITKIEMGSMKIERQRTKLKDLLEDIYETIKRNSDNKNLQFKLELPNDISPLYIDKDLIRIAVNNLLTNAVKYSNSDGVITLSAEESDNAVYIRVRDQGIGIPESERPLIFDRFYRSESEDVRSRVGHGLGLSLVRDIVEMHSGLVNLKSEVDKGTEFTITLENNSDLLEKVV